jgi:hypothetical protein
LCFFEEIASRRVVADGLAGIFGTVRSRSSGVPSGDGGLFAGFQIDAGASLGRVFGHFSRGRVGHVRVFPIQYVSDLCTVAESQATRLARINFLDRDLNPGSLVGWPKDVPDVSFRNGDPGLALGVDHFDHFVSRVLWGIGK